jgi:hypothetical protein
MGHKLVLDVPEKVYGPLVKTAQQTGATPEQLAVEWLLAASWHAAHDPVEDFIGAFRSSVPGWADQHDKYIGQALKESPGREKTPEG